MVRTTRKAPDEGKKPVISYYTKDKVYCPVCRKSFEHEDMLSGGGRMIAGSLTDELHRIFEPSARFGPVYPLLYAIGACPVCHTALFWNDFKTLAPDDAKIILENEDERKKAVSAVFPYYNLTRNRTLFDGAAMYYLALLTYEKTSAAYSPTIKKAIIALRLAWLCGDLNAVCPGRNYDYVQQVFYRKAMFFYQQALEYETGRVESIAGVANFGPDIDKNYGYDGVVYLCGLLEYKYGQREDNNLRLKKLDEYKRAIARIFGLGKSSKNKPGPLLEHSRNLYDSIAKELKDASDIDIDLDDD
ncbi:DUF2225 domain-containing protein [Treponema brennaborense]|uniref:DUF2225 domain-containing protein n=1 Tax=Treponema brennaborense (strain DSM 12168 / CIP 105900 / DD5/3) TaxID=906968 RepID=F4LKZ9_TREBD|nr:DUF2225 domain-containing protein [Treponema brennaborense]AEE16596.1 Protein of unknown function DUF2225 [Treponema brennaborense DSM 12168]